MSQPLIIGVAGTNGSGKDTVMRLLSDKYNLLFVSATDLLTSELERDHLPTDRLHKAERAAAWRRESGLGVIVKKAYEAYQSQTDKYDGLVVGSLRHPAEVEEIHNLGGQVLWIDADPKLRYERVQANDRGRVEDRVSFEQFMADEEREMHPVGDAATLNMAEVKKQSDLIFLNETSVADLATELERVLVS